MRRSNVVTSRGFCCFCCCCAGERAADRVATREAAEFDDADAKVVCKQLGYKNGASAGDAIVAPPLTPRLLTKLRCTGNEATVSQCSVGPLPARPFGYDGGGSTSAVSVACSNWTPRAL